MSVKFLKRLSDEEFLELFRESFDQLIIEKIERSECEFKFYLACFGDNYTVSGKYKFTDFDCEFFEHDFWRALLYKKSGSEYANAYLESLAERYKL